MSDEHVMAVVNGLRLKAKLDGDESIRTGDAGMSMIYEVQAKAIEAVLADRTALRDEVKALREALQKVSDIRDSIVGMQGFNFSEHAYPLVAVLNAAGFKGAGYEISRKNLGTLIEQIKAAEEQRDSLARRVVEVEADNARLRIETESQTRAIEELIKDAEHIDWDDVRSFIGLLKHRDDAIRERDSALATCERLRRLARQLVEIAESATFVIDNGVCGSCQKNIDNIPVESIDALRAELASIEKESSNA